jgi:hypothetical protein
MNSIKSRIIFLLKIILYLFLLYHCLTWICTILSTSLWNWTPVISELLLFLIILFVSWLVGYLLRIRISIVRRDIFWFDYLLIILNTVIISSIKYRFDAEIYLYLMISKAFNFDFIFLLIPNIIICSVFVILWQKRRRRKRGASKNTSEDDECL